MKHFVATAFAAVALTGCAGAQIERDLKHAELADQYRGSLASATPFDAPGQCDNAAQGKLDAWTTVNFSTSTKVFELPNGVKAEAVCLRIPERARIVQVDADAKGGMTYYELMVVRPSLLFLDQAHAPIKDFQKVTLMPGDGWTGFQLTGNVAFGEALAGARHMVVYVHPASIEGLVSVNTGYQSIPVPYSPYGSVRIRFK